MASERDKMLRGDLYDASDAELVRLRLAARRLWQRLNALPADAGTERRDVLAELLGSVDDGVILEPPFYCDSTRRSEREAS